MASPSLIALTLFVAWALLLMTLMEIIRSKLVLQKAVVANEFRPDNANLSPFMQRLARAHANCIENIPVLGGLLLIAIVSGREHVTDPLAYVLVAARLLQSLIHLSSSSLDSSYVAIHCLLRSSDDWFVLVFQTAHFNLTAIG